MSLLRSANLLRRTPPALARGLSTSAPSMDVSRILLVGRLATHPTVRLSASGSEYAAYTVATRDPSRGPQDTTTSFHRIFAFGSNADRVRSLQKGAPVYVEADFRVERLTVEDRTQEKYLVSQRFIQHLKNLSSPPPPARSDASVAGHEEAPQPLQEGEQYVQEEQPSKAQEQQ